ncbi:hypothetical protein ACLMJK_002443 [Lecanora helva]
MPNPSKGTSRTRSYIQFITTPTADTPGTALLLHFNNKRYIIGNIHEGLQRAGLQSGSRFFRARDFFITGKTEWQSNGGLLGMILSIADASTASAAAQADNLKIKEARRKAKEAEEMTRQKSKKGGNKPPQQPTKAHQPGNPLQDPKHTGEDSTITLHGGPNLTHTIATARSFVFRHGTPIKVNENQEEEGATAQDRDFEPSWEDDMIQVWAMPITPTTTDAPRPSSPRKRSLGEYMDDNASASAGALNDQWSVEPRAPADQDKRDQQIREFIVEEMFSSTWRYDNLVETQLQDVVMPARIYVRDKKTRKLVTWKGPVPGGTASLPDIKVLVRQPWPGSLVDHLPPTKPSAVAMSYIIRNHKQRGKFKPEIAQALNVPKGPLWSTLTRGGEVQSSDGKTVTPDMVLEAGEDGGGIAVVDLPSQDYIPNLLNRLEWETEKVMKGVGAIVWILGPEVSNDKLLREFMRSKPDLSHIISSPDHCPNYLAQTSAATAAIRHNQVDPLRFPIPVHSNTVPPSTGTALDQLMSDSSQLQSNFLPAKRGLRIDLEPSFGIAEDDVVSQVDNASIVQETSKKVIHLARTAQKYVESHAADAAALNGDLPSPDAEIICLGTGSASPSTFRNVAGTLLRVPGHGSYLFDCGENTLGQLKRTFSGTELSEILRDLKLIWISHLHADHHLGTTSIIRAWYEEVHGRDPKRRTPSLTEQLLDPVKFLEEGKRLFIVAHGHMMRWLQEYSSVEDFGYQQLIPVTSFPAHWSQPEKCNLEWNGLNVGFNTSKDPAMRSAMRKATSLSNLVSVPVNHCYGAQAVSLTFPNGFKFSYSGDCRPSKEFAVIGRGSTVLLHEATFEDELIRDAEAKKHSTTSEAIGVGLAMGAKRVILTHFSQRYQKIPSTASLDSLQLRLEEASDGAEDPMEDMEPLANIEAPHSVGSDPPIGVVAQGSQQDGLSEDSGMPLSKLTATSSRFTSLESMADLIQPQPTSMKLVIAFDYMRVKVGDIVHLERFTPAIRELYKEVAWEEAIVKKKKAEKAAAAEVTHSKPKAGNGGPETAKPRRRSTEQSKKKEERNRSEQREVERPGSPRAEVPAELIESKPSPQDRGLAAAAPITESQRT